MAENIDYQDLLGCVVEIFWDDASYEFEPGDIEAMEDSWPVLTWGRLVRETNNAVYVAGEWFVGNNTGMRAVTRVPKAIVLAVTKLGEDPLVPKDPQPGSCDDCTHDVQDVCYCDCHGDAPFCQELVGSLA